MLFSDGEIINNLNVFFFLENPISELIMPVISSPV
jgi:hypothetical protein